MIQVQAQNRRVVTKPSPKYTDSGARKAQHSKSIPPIDTFRPILSTSRAAKSRPGNSAKLVISTSL
uniref:Uncharacterized protein n=1 Tax=Arundo donax TaxID=35708 RepID=A0A0A9DVE7_ARUDO